MTYRLPQLNVDRLQALLSEELYIAERSLAVALYLSLTLPKPLFLEGEAGVGKTEVAKVLSRILDQPLIRLQCYEGLDINSAVYEWNYTQQMLHIRIQEAAGPVDARQLRTHLFSPEFLLRRPLLQAVDNDLDRPCILLIDELDRADEEFEAFLLELLSDFQITVPEIGTIRARHIPHVIITSNRTREIHDALKRRCLYHWVDYPDFAREQAIVLAKVPQAPVRLAEMVVGFVQELRQQELYKIPGVAETLDWLQALIAMDAQVLTEGAVQETLGVLLKYRDDIEFMQRAEVNRLIEMLDSRAQFPVIEPV